MNAALEGPLNFVGRTLLVLIFLASGAGKIKDFEGTQPFMKSKGVPAPAVFLAGAIALEVAGSLLVISGFKARYGAFLLAVFLVPAALIFHNFWTETDPMAWQNQMSHFMKNVSILGGLISVMARGAGSWSIDSMLSRQPTERPA